MHGAPPELHGVPETRRALLWGLGLPLIIAILAVTVTPWALLLAGVYPAQVARLARRLDPVQAFFLTLGKFPEAQGALQFYWRRLRGAEGRLIEYK